MRTIELQTANPPGSRGPFLGEPPPRLPSARGAQPGRRRPPPGEGVPLSLEAGNRPSRTLMTPESRHKLFMRSCRQTQEGEEGSGTGWQRFVQTKPPISTATSKWSTTNPRTASHPRDLRLTCLRNETRTPASPRFLSLPLSPSLALSLSLSLLARVFCLF